MKIKSILPDDKILASNVLVELTIGEYLEIANDIIDQNEYQRKKVIKSAIKDLLKIDLLEGCSIPPIVLSIKLEELPETFEYKTFDDESTVQKAFNNKKLIIIDGLQRTFVMLGIKEELEKEIRGGLFNDDYVLRLTNFLNLKIRAEIYVGLNRLGILYRMITLNTGQTTMSTRHLMEILYLDYLTSGLDDVQLVLEKEDKKINPDTNQFNFKDVLDGFNSYIEKDENLIERSEILDNIKSLKSLAKEDPKIDLFKQFVLLYKKLLDKLISLSNNWEYHPDDFKSTEFEIKSIPYGNNPIEIFKRSQALSGFGAAVANLRDLRKMRFDVIESAIDNIYVNDTDASYFYKLVIKDLDIIRDKSKKIGNDQRLFFRNFFKELLDNESDHPNELNNAVDVAFSKTRAERFSKGLL